MCGSCASGARSSGSPNARGASVDPPSGQTPWQKLDWIQEQMRDASEMERAELLVRAAELYFSVDRPESAGQKAREANYTVGSGTPAGSSVTSRAHAVLGAIALQRFDNASARRELTTAIQTAVSDVDSSAAFCLMAMVEERAERMSEAAILRGRARRSSDPRVVELLRPFQVQAEPAAAMRNGASSSGAIANDSRLKIVSRSQWKPNRIGSETDPMAPPRRITVHHEGKEFKGTTLDETLRQVKNIQEFHQRARKWADIAYHFVIDPLGNVIEGRPLTLQGAHAGEKNQRGESPNYANIGISLLGNFDVQQPTRAQEEALRQLIAQLETTYSIPNSEVFTHAEIREKFNIGPTGCPGKNLKPLVTDIRRRGPLAARDGGSAQLAKR